ncbi:MAG TPA: protein kinase [Polyangiaceae bacterium]|nr:protein kinase [Polyangiaceae bacterium]
MAGPEEKTEVDGGLQTAPALPSLPPTGPSDYGSFASSLQSQTSRIILGREEAARSVALLRLIAPIALLGVVTVWIPKEGMWRGLCTASFSATFLMSLWLLRRFRDPERFDYRLALAHGLLAVVSILAATLAVGVFSPTVMAACVGIYFFGQSDSARAGWVIYVTLAVGYLVLQLAGIAGWIPLDRALVSIVVADVPGLLTLVFMVQAMFALTFWMARQSRKATLDAFQRVEQAGIEVRQRDALLNEARADLDRADAAHMGRYTGQRVAGYQVGEIIGRGAMGEVYAGLRSGDDRPVALKFLHPMVLSEEKHLDRFMREAKIAAALNSPHVVKILELGNSNDGIPFIAMERLEGEDLARKLRGKKQLKISEVLTLVSEVAQGLSLADERGIVHRDLKPQNLFLAQTTEGAVWKILDFGVSKINAAGATATQGGAVGTPSYMAPEQAKGRDVDHRADVFALGVIAYRALTGKPPFTGPDSLATLYNVVHVQPTRPSQLRPLPRDVDRVLALSLAKDVARRIESASALSDALSAAASGRLDPGLRSRADALLGLMPWGHEV